MDGGATSLAFTALPSKKAPGSGLPPLCGWPASPCQGFKSMWAQVRVLPASRASKRKLSGGKRGHTTTMPLCFPRTCRAPNKCVSNIITPQYSYGSLLVLILPIAYLLSPSPLYCQGWKSYSSVPRTEGPQSGISPEVSGPTQPPQDRLRPKPRQRPWLHHVPLPSASPPCRLAVFLPLEQIPFPFYNWDLGNCLLGPTGGGMMAHSDRQGRMRTSMPTVSRGPAERTSRPAP